MRGSKDNKIISAPGWNAVWAIYSVDNFWRSILLPILLSAFVLAICIYSDKHSIVFIEYVSSATLMIGPAILGFTLSGYALMMGLSSSEFIQGLAHYKEEGKSYSMFQSLNATFAVVLFMAFITTIMGVCADLFLKANISSPKFLMKYSEFYNWICFYVLLFFLFYTINAIKDVVINIFNFGQYVQACIDSETEIDGEVEN